MSGRRRMYKNLSLYLLCLIGALKKPEKRMKIKTDAKTSADKQNAEASKIHIDIKANHFKIALSRCGDQREKHQKLHSRTTEQRSRETNKNTTSL